MPGYRGAISPNYNQVSRVFFLRLQGDFSQVNASDVEIDIQGLNFTYSVQQLLSNTLVVRVRINSESLEDRASESNVTALVPNLYTVQVSLSSGGSSTPVAYIDFYYE